MIKAKLSIFSKRLSEVTPACLLMMVQGNVSAITIPHWITAFKTGILTGAVMVAFSFIPNKQLEENKYATAAATGFVTMVIDGIVHPSHFLGLHGEAIVTGLAAAVLTLLMSNVWGKK
jgi:hypothetical protein